MKQLTAQQIIEENECRRARLYAAFDPITGEGSIGVRVAIDAALLPPKWSQRPTGMSASVWLPEPLHGESLIKRMIEAGGPDKLAEKERKPLAMLLYEAEMLRLRHDFAYWAGAYCRIKRKGGGDDCLLRLTHPQRKFVTKLEEFRLTGKPVRLVLLKARQWGGSTVSQLYMAWLQLVHSEGLNSLIIAHQGTASDEIKDMFDRMIKGYPIALLKTGPTAWDGSANEDEPKMVGVGKTRSIFRVPQRNCKVKIGTAERPDSCRGGDYNLVHLSEVGLWKATQGKKPEDIIRAACAGVMYKPMTMIVYESTANGIGNFFHREYVDARDNPKAQFKAFFISWFDIEQNTLDFESEEARLELAQQLIDNRLAEQALTNREEPGRYLWRLWQLGATLEGINWYVMERAKHSQHGSMAAECPSDDTEAFVNSGAAVFDKYQVEEFRPGCRPPAEIGDVSSLHADEGEECLENVKFSADSQGMLWIWKHPETDRERLEDRYVAVVDIGGRSYKSDWSVIVVFDRKPQLEGNGPEVVAQWYGHIDMDRLAWKSAQIAAYYNVALLVIESNTLETHDPLRQVDGDQSQFILNQLRRAYPRLYARRQSEEDIRQGLPRKYGFHTNVATKPMVISTLVKVVRDKLYTERDERCLNEYATYERKPNGAYGAILGAHDDLLMTRAIGLHICLCELPPLSILPSQQYMTKPQRRLF